MKVLLDTNIIIHRESARVLHEDIGILFNWLDKLKCEKCVHPITIQEINKLKEGELRRTFTVKLAAYTVLQVQALLHPKVQSATVGFDNNDNDRNDTILLNEVYSDRVDYLITEDRKISKKAAALDLADRVFTIDAFLEKVTIENPSLLDYKVLSVKKELFGNIDLNDEFFSTFKEDYPEFSRWFNKKSEKNAYVCKAGEKVVAFLFLKIEDKNEPYPDIFPPFQAKKRLKIGTLKVALNGYKLGERFLKIIFDNALRFKVDEVYVTLFDKRIGQERLISLLEDFGFSRHGIKRNPSGDELVYVRRMAKELDSVNPRLTYPFFSRNSRAFLVPIYPEYHTELFPDSILRNESPDNFVENEPFRNAIGKVYISRSFFRDLTSGDIIIFYRTGGFYKSVISTIGIVENVVIDIKDSQHFIRLCRKRSVFTDNELVEHWNYRSSSRPFIVNFLYAYSFPKRLNMQRLIEIGVISDVNSAPRGFERINKELFSRILEETQTDESFIID
jgi:predicted nucleic acid-binding protein